MKKKSSILLLVVILGYSFYTLIKSLVPEATFDPYPQLRHQNYISRLPRDLTFAGEQVHFQDPGAYIRFYREQQTNASKNSATRLLLRNTRIWLPQISKILKEENIPLDFQYVVVAESNLSNAISHRGAGGFWQLQIPTAKEYGLEINDEIDERFHPIKSTKAACKYFREAHRLFGSWTSAAASYNSGMYGLQKALQSQSVNSYYLLELNNETASYIYRILSIKDLVNNPYRYGMQNKKHSPTRVRKIKVDKNIPDLREFARLNGSTYQMLKELNPWLLKNTLTIKAPGKTYLILLPNERIVNENAISGKVSKDSIVGYEKIESPNTIQTTNIPL